MLVHEIATVEADNKVGLFRRDDGRCVLQVPFGLEHLAPNRALALLYMSFIVFRRTRRSFNRLSAVDGVERRSKAGLQPEERDVSFCDALALDELFDQVDPRSVLSLCDHPARHARDIYRRIDRHLHQAVFDEEGTAYLERVPGHRRLLQYGRADIVGLYCFLGLDFYQNFLNVDPTSGWGNFAQDGAALAAEFQHRYLTPQDSLYLGDLELRERCRERMRYLLNAINRASSVRDATYRKLYDALHRYLHAGVTSGKKEGQIWGVDDFWAVWESICLCHAAEKVSGGDLTAICTCDFEHLPQGLSTYALETGWLKWREKLFARNDICRRPDLVLNKGSEWTVVDFKYYNQPTLQRPKWKEDAKLNKIERDFLNMEVYGLLLKNHLLAAPAQTTLNVRLEMWMPGTSDRLDRVSGSPHWDPPLSIRTLPTAKVMEQYVALYARQGGATYRVGAPVGDFTKERLA